MARKLFRDPVHDIISLSVADDCDRMLMALLKSREFQRLRRIRQLGMANMVYPGAEHSRFTHSIGVMHMARRVLDQVCPEDPGPGLRMTTLAAALLHDVGHGPFSHAIEKVTRTHHESISIGLILDPDTEVHAILRDIDPSLPSAVAHMIGPSQPRTFLRDVVSSQLDADRLDYILRDGLATGVKIGVYDVERILSTLEATPEHLVISLRAKEAVEGYLMARFHMFKQVYLHKAVRSAEKMLEAALARAAQLLQADAQALPLPSPALGTLLRGEPMTPRVFAQLDDTDVWMALKLWSRDQDAILAELCDGLLCRRLFKIIELPRDAALATEMIEVAREVIVEGGGEPRYHLMTDRAEDTPYKPYIPGRVDGDQQPIMLRLPHGLGRIEEHSDIVHLLGRDRYEIHRLCFPDRFRDEITRRLALPAR